MALELVHSQSQPFAKVRGEPLLELPADLYIPPDALEVFLDTFEGPLDLLLYLIRKANVDILDIPMARLTQQYLQYVEVMRRKNLELAAEYLVMAAWLAYLKSRLLLPAAGPADEPSPEDLAARLAFQLRHLEAMREVGAELLRRPRLGVDVFSRGRPEPVEVNTETVLQASLYDLLRAYGRWHGRQRRRYAQRRR